MDSRYSTKDGKLIIKLHNQPIYTASFITDPTGFTLHGKINGHSYLGDTDDLSTWERPIMESASGDQANALINSAIVLNDVFKRLHGRSLLYNLHGQNIEAKNISWNFADCLKTFKQARDYQHYVNNRIQNN